MSVDEFRQLVLSFDGAVEGSHMGHPDFRFGGKIFASLAPDLTWGMAKLTPEQQASLMSQHPTMFEPASGKWGLAGATKIILVNAESEPVGEALTLAWQNVSKKK